VTFSQIFEVATAILTSLGGAVVILFAFSNWLGKVWAGRLMEKEKAEHARDLEGLKTKFLLDTEKYKTALKKSEFIFQKEYDATSTLIGLIREIQPTLSHPEMDWYDACDDIALNFPNIEQKLEKFLSTHGAVLQDTARDLIIRCIARVAEGQFEAPDPDHISREANASAGHLIDDLQKVEKLLMQRVHGQSSI
jgi:hypothetical protein